MLIWLSYRTRQTRGQQTISQYMNSAAAIKSSAMSQTCKPVQTCTAAKRSEKETSRRDVDQNERKMPNEKSNPLKCRLRRGSYYLTGSDKCSAHFCFQQALGSELGRSRGYSHSACVSRAGPMSYYERVELPAVTLLGSRGQEGLLHGREHAFCDRQDRNRPY
jgi:hypothetical protein